MEVMADTTKRPLSNNLVPTTKFARKVFGMMLSNKATTAAGLTLTIERDTEVVRTVPEITIGALATIDISRNLESPILTIPAGLNVKAQVTTGTGPVCVILQCYDI